MLLFSNEENKEDKKKTSIKDNKNKKVNNALKTAKVKTFEEEQQQIFFELKNILSFKQIGDKLLQQFKDKKLHHTIMLSGKYGIGKATFTYYLIKQMITSQCIGDENEDVLNKMHIEALKNNIHPDVFYLQLKEGESEIKIDYVREFIKKIAFKPVYGSKFAIIDDINSINVNGVNALLKTLEEPPMNTYFFIINHNTTMLLDTIYSRCNEIKLHLSRSECMTILQELHQNLTFDEVEFYTDLSGNSVGFAKILASMNIFSEISGIKDSNQKIAYLLNDIYVKIDKNFKNLSTSIKMSLLENIVLYFIDNNLRDNLIVSNNDNIENIVSRNLSLIKQFTGIKRFELPVKFV